MGGDTHNSITAATARRRSRRFATALLERWCMHFAQPHMQPLEVAFYNNALAAVKQSKLLLKQQSIPYKRPPDFLCEMVKSDSHMAKVRVDSRSHLYSVYLGEVCVCRMHAKCSACETLRAAR
eukprot:12586-Heterococcus_DN1.PRE.3